VNAFGSEFVPALPCRATWATAPLCKVNTASQVEKTLTILNLMNPPEDGNSRSHDKHCDKKRATVFLPLSAGMLALDRIEASSSKLLTETGIIAKART